MLRLFLVLLLATVASAQTDDYYDGGDKGAGQGSSGSDTVTTSSVATTTSTLAPTTMSATDPPKTTPTLNQDQKDTTQNQVQNGGSDTVTTSSVATTTSTLAPTTTSATDPAKTTTTLNQDQKDTTQNQVQNGGSDTVTTSSVATTTSTLAPTTTSATAPATTTTSTTTTTPTTTTTSPTTTTTTNGLPSNPKINQICSGNRGMNDRIRTIALEGHNYRRSRLALGRVRKNNGAFLRPATNMIKLRYDCRLETSAKGVADRCTTSKSTLPPQVKENIHSIHRSRARFRTDAMIEAIKHWWGQVRLVPGIGMRAIFREKHEYSTIRYFTLMAWATTKYIGCAVSQSCGSYWYIVCHYRVGGNVVNEHVYMPGRTCTQCPMGYYCDPSNGLCTKA